MSIIGNGWKSRYDYPGMSNMEKLTGRRLHTQDNAWFIAKIFFVLLAWLVFYLILNGDLSFAGVATLLKYAS